MCDILRAKGNDIGTHSCKKAREEWLLKFADQNHGRDVGGPMLYATISSVSTEQSWKNQTKPEQNILIIGYVLVLCYAAFSAFMKAPKNQNISSHLGFMAVSIFGVVFVFLGLVCGWGLSAGYLNIKLNTASVQVLPFLLIGIGINDQFVMTAAYNRIFSLAPIDTTAVKIIGSVLADVGPSITLTSIANICAFLVAIRMRIRLIRDFAAIAILSVAAIFFSLLFGFSAVLAIHCTLTFRNRFLSCTTKNNEHSVHGQEAMRIDDDFEKKESSRMSIPRAIVHSFERSIDIYARYMSKSIISFCIVFVTIVVVVVLCPLYLPQLRTNSGLPIEELFIPGSSEADASKIIEKLKRVPASVQHKAFDIAHLHPYYAPLNIGDYSLLQTFADAQKTEDFSLSWYHIFVQWANPCAYLSFTDADVATFSAEDCTTSFYQSALTFNPRCSPSDPFSAGNCGPRVTADKVFDFDEHELAPIKAQIATPSGLANSGIPVCTIWPVWMYKCNNGTSQCFANYLRDEDLDAARDPPLLGFHPDYFYECLNLWINADAQWVFLNPLFLCHDPENFQEIIQCDSVSPGSRQMWRGADGQGDMEFSSVRAFIFGLASLAGPWITYLDSALPRLRTFEKETGIYGFQGSKDEKFFTQFRYLHHRLWMTILIAMLVLFAVICSTFFCLTSNHLTILQQLFQASWTAVIIIFNIFVALLLTCCVFAATNFKLNMFSAVNLIMAVGFAVDFVTHLAFMYIRIPSGNNEFRVRHAMRLLLPPIVDGSISTLCSIVPLAASRYPYIVKYFFGLYAMIACFGIFVGVCLLPATLSLAGPFNCLPADTSRTNNHSFTDISGYHDDSFQSEGETNEKDNKNNIPSDS